MDDERIISPEFSNDVKEYSLEVPNGTTSIVVIADKDDSSANITGAGEVSVNEGINRIEVKVTAENGNINTFVINVIVKELDPIEVKINDKTMRLVSSQNNFDFDTFIPEGFHRKR